jgi:Ca2+-binding RTX toxin-like protein
MERRLSVVLFGFRKIGIICFLMLLFVVLSFSQVSAQETGTLIVYEEAQGGDATFSFSGSGSVGNFQLATEDSGGARVFDLPAGTYTVTQNSLPSGWSTQEVFCDGTGTFSSDESQGKATFTVSSPADVVYVRFTNTKTSTNPTAATSPTPSPSVPENISLPLLLSIVALVTCFMVFLSKKKKTVAPVLAVFLSILMATAFIGHVQANPDKFIQLGTSGNDDQIQDGTPNKDVIVQLGFGGNDTQYAEGAENDDFIIQNGGAGQNEQTILLGDGNDHAIQEGGDGSDSMYIDHGTGNVNVTQNGGNGEDVMEVYGGGNGKGQINVNGEAGNDQIKVTGSLGDDEIKIFGGSGDDKINYVVSGGADLVFIEGGPGNDFLSISGNQQSFQLLEGTNTILYSVGSGGSTITIANIEHGLVLGDDGKVAFQW